MNLNYLASKRFFLAFSCLFALGAFYSDGASASQGEKIFNYDDQYVLIEAGMLSGGSKSALGIEILMTPKPGWKLLAGDSSSVKPLRLKFAASKCFKLKDTPRYSPPDLAATDDSGAYSEYFTKTASIKQELTRLKCSQKNGFDGSATLSYLLCQDNKCIGPFSREISFRVQ